MRGRRNRTHALRNLSRGEAPRRQRERDAARDHRPGRHRGGPGPRRDLARRDPLQRLALDPVGPPRVRQLPGRAHPPPPDRDRGAGAPARQPPADRGGGRHRRPAQRGPPRFRRRPQRLGPHLRSARRALRGEPGPLPRVPRDHPGGLEGPALQLRGRVLPLPHRDRLAHALPGAAPAHAHGGQLAGDLPAGREAWPAALHRPARPGHPAAARPPQGLPRGVARVRTGGPRGRVPAHPGLRGAHRAGRPRGAARGDDLLLRAARGAGSLRARARRRRSRRPPAGAWPTGSSTCRTTKS